MSTNLIAARRAASLIGQLRLSDSHDDFVRHCRNAYLATLAAQDAGDPELMLRSTFYLTQVYRRAGDTTSAIDALNSLDRALLDAGAPQWLKARLFFELGETRSQSLDPVHATDFYRLALEVVRQNPGRCELTEADILAGEASFHFLSSQANPPQANHALSLVVGLLPNPSAALPISLARIYAVCAILLADAADLDRSRRCYQALTDVAAAHPDDEQLPVIAECVRAARSSREEGSSAALEILRRVLRCQPLPLHPAAFQWVRAMANSILSLTDAHALLKETLKGNYEQLRLIDVCHSTIKQLTPRRSLQFFEKILYEQEVRLLSRLPARDIDAINALEEICVVSEGSDDESGYHPYRVASLAFLIAVELGLDREYCDRIRIAALLADVGKHKSRQTLSRLAWSAEEFRQLAPLHVVHGQSLVSLARFERNSANASCILSVVANHHERLDGSGYPQGLSGDAIPMDALIVAVADVFDSMTHARPWRPACGVDSALSYLNSRAGVAFDRSAVDALSKVIETITVQGRPVDSALMTGVQPSARALRSLRLNAPVSARFTPAH